MNDTEEWRPVVDWEGYYDVSDFGRARSYWKKVGRGKGNGRGTDRILVAEPTILKGNRHVSGYIQLTMRLRNGPPVRKMIHVLILEAFVGPCPPGMEGCHFPDDDKTNNRLSNLRWDTHTENNIDLLRLSATRVAKLRQEDIPVIRERLANGETPAAVAKDYPVSRRTIEEIKDGLTWTYLPTVPDLKKPTPAQVAASHLRATGNHSVSYHDVHLIHEIARLAGLKESGPGTSRTVLGAIKRSNRGDLVQGYIPTCRKVRCFWLPEHSPFGDHC